MLRCSQSSFFALRDQLFKPNVFHSANKIKVVEWLVDIPVVHRQDMHARSLNQVITPAEVPCQHVRKASQTGKRSQDQCPNVITAAPVRSPSRIKIYEVLKHQN